MENNRDTQSQPGTASYQSGGVIIVDQVLNICNICDKTFAKSTPIGVGTVSELSIRNSASGTVVLKMFSNSIYDLRCPNCQNWNQVQNGTVVAN